MSIGQHLKEGAIARWAQKEELPPIETGLSDRALVVSDDFDAPDQLLHGRVCSTGQVWDLTGAGQATTGIVDGAMEASANTYASLLYPTTLDHVSAVFSLTAGTPGPQPVLMMQSEARDLQNMLHLQINPAALVLDKSVGGSFTPAVLWADMFPRLLTDGTQYRVSMTRVGNTITIDLPNGRQASYTHSDVGALDLRAATLQIFDPTAGTLKPRWHSIAMGGARRLNTAIAHGGAHQSAVTQAAGVGILRRQSIVHVVNAGGPTWYRIARHTTVDTHVIHGRIGITAEGAYGASHCIASIIAAYNAAPMVYREYERSGLGHLVSVRVGTTSDSCYIDIEANPADSDLKLHIVAEGYIDLLTVPEVSPTTPDNIKTITVNAGAMYQGLV